MRPTNAPPTSVRFNDDVLEFVDSIRDTIDKSSLKDNLKHSRKDVVEMIIRYMKEKGGNELFLMLLDNVESPNSVDTYTVRGLVNAITKKDLSDSEFKTAINSVEIAEV